MARQRRAVLELLPKGPAASLVASGALAGKYGETVTFTRATAKVVPTGPATVATVSSGQPAVAPQGLLIEAAHTNLVLRNRDLTQTWTLSDATAAKTATGVDGVVNSASTLTATADNGYAAQTVTATDARVTSVYLRRRTGAGTVELSRDGGATYTDVTLSVGAAWGRVSVTSTVVNPEIRIRLGTEEDAVDVDFVQDEPGAYAHSAVTTAGASATCNVDVVTMSSALLPVAAGSLEFEFTPLWATPAALVCLLDTRDGSDVAGLTVRVASTGEISLITTGAAASTTITSSGVTWVAGTRYRLRAVWGAGNTYLYRNDVLLASNTTGTANMPSAQSSLHIGETRAAASTADGYFSNLRFLP